MHTFFFVLCFVVVMQSFIMNSHEIFIHIHQGCFAGTGAIVILPQCQWSKPDRYGKISQCITTTKHSKAVTVCIFLWIYSNNGMRSCYRFNLRISIILLWFYIFRLFGGSCTLVICIYLLYISLIHSTHLLSMLSNHQLMASNKTASKPIGRRWYLTHINVVDMQTIYLHWI